MRPVLLYDGACAFCRRWIERWRARTGDRVDYVPIFGRLDAATLETDAGTYRGAEAVFRTLEYAPEVPWYARLGRLPVVRVIAELVYRLIAKHRTLASRVDRWLFGRR